MGTLGNDPKKKTVLFSCHYDVVPATQYDGWETEPFNLVHRGERLFGRGVSDSKGPCIIWISAMEAYLNVCQELPVNIKVSDISFNYCLEYFAHLFILKFGGWFLLQFILFM